MNGNGGGDTVVMILLLSSHLHCDLRVLGIHDQVHLLVLINKASISTNVVGECRCMEQTMYHYKVGQVSHEMFG
jgi:hypothetical protein